MLLDDAVSSVISKLRVQGITDKHAIAAFLGSIQQESNFNPEAWNSYEGSYGIMQWRLGRRQRLYKFCADRMDFHCQLAYVFTESDWEVVNERFQSTGHSIEYYNDLMYEYLRWGEEGSRVKYAYQFLQFLDV